MLFIKLFTTTFQICTQIYKNIQTTCAEAQNICNLSYVESLQKKNAYYLMKNVQSIHRT